MNGREFDIAVIGGGLAGLSLAIQMRRKGHSVILFEKNSYPFHRVCGEYISMESLGFLRFLGIDPLRLEASRIVRLEVTSSRKNILKQPLDPGGIGISRFVLDHELAGIAGNEGVCMMENTTVRSIYFSEDGFHIQSGAGEFSTKLAAGCFGKRSRLDQHWKRAFSDPVKEKKENYVGVKYHFRSDSISQNTIYLHHFPGGYCGVVKVEAERYCLCYLTTAQNLALAGNNVREMEKNILCTNPVLKQVLEEAEFTDPEPVVISQVSFARKSLVEDHVLMVGDAAGMITPLCGNGMSMALHASKIAGGLFDSFLRGQVDRNILEKEYRSKWRQEFSRRMWVGRKVQGIFGRPALLSGLIRTGRMFPSVTKSLVRQTHGREF